MDLPVAINVKTVIYIDEEDIYVVIEDDEDYEGIDLNYSYWRLFKLYITFIYQSLFNT
jgi:hypothetical protein